MNSPCWVDILWKEAPFYNAWLDDVIAGQRDHTAFSDGKIHGAVIQHLQKNKDKSGERLGNEWEGRKNNPASGKELERFHRH